MLTATGDQNLVLSRNLGPSLNLVPTSLPFPSNGFATGPEPLSALREEVVELSTKLREAEQEIRRLQLLVGEDALTGLGNRRSFNRELSRFLSSTERSGRAGCLIYADLNGMKAVNDSFGHEAGDLLLKHFAQCLRQQIRLGDFIARLGGDEFAILLPDTERANAEHKVKCLEKLLADTPLSWRDATIPVSVAFGVHLIECGESAAEVVEAADKAMYSAKRALGGSRSAG